MANYSPHTESDPTRAVSKALSADISSLAVLTPQQQSRGAATEARGLPEPEMFTPWPP